MMVHFTDDRLEEKVLLKWGVFVNSIGRMEKHGDQKKHSHTSMRACKPTQKREASVCVIDYLYMLMYI